MTQTFMNALVNLIVETILTVSNGDVSAFRAHIKLSF
jgi:hypothetical protein